LNNNNHQLSVNRNQIPRKAPNPPPNIILVKEGDLTIRKGIYFAK